MLPFGVIQIEHHRVLQQKAAPPFLPEICRPEFPLLNRSSTGSRHAKLDRQIADPVPDRSSRRAFTIVSAQHTCCLTQKNDPVLPKWASTSNWNWTKNRSYRKQTTKPCLTGTRTHIRLSPNFAKTAHDFATFESENTELPLWDPLWKTRRFLQSDPAATRFCSKYRMRRNLLKTNDRDISTRGHNRIPGPHEFRPISTKVVIEKL